MRFKRYAIAVLPALLVAVTPAIAQPKPSSAPQTSPSLNSQPQQELQQFREKERLQELIRKDLEDSKVIGDRVQAEVDRAFGRMMAWLNVLLVVLTLFPILTVLGFVLLRRSVISQSLTEIQKSGEETKRGVTEQINTSKQEIEQIASDTKHQLDDMVSEAKQVLEALRKQTALAQTELDSLSTEAKSKFEKAASDLQQQQGRISQLSQQLSILLPESIQEPVNPENLPKVQAITTELETLQSASPEIALTAYGYLNQGNAFLYAARYEDAITSFVNALTLKLDFYAAWNNRGLAQMYLQQYDNAIASYDQALILNPELPKAWNNRGLALKSLHQYKEAIASFDEALKHETDFHKARYNKACCYVLEGKVELAVENLQEAINLNADYREKAKTDSDFDAIREDERFKQLIEG